MAKSKQNPVGNAPKKKALSAPASRRSEAVRKHTRVVELFAGVGGFRVGFEKANAELKNRQFRVIWSNQWEPSTKRQHASEVYEARFGKEHHSNQDIAEAVKAKVLPKAFDLLVGGFPCQDYSVARTLNQSVGIQGKKGVLWWEIRNILEAYRPPYGLFENVDRLLKSPARQRGRDFAVMLASLADLGYQAEWRVINSAEYGFPQRRKRVFILIYREDLPLARDAKAGREQWLVSTGVLAKALPCTARRANVEGSVCPNHSLSLDLAAISKEFNKDGTANTPFKDAGLLVGRDVYSLQTLPVYYGQRRTLGDVLQKPDEVPEHFIIPEAELSKWGKLKGAKSLTRRKANGLVYTYDEGRIAFPDLLDRPSRTIVTGEGGRAASRFKHVIKTPEGLWRRLTPVELERLNGFPDGHTSLGNITEGKRAFFMGNALVTGIVTRIGLELANRVW